MFHSVKNEIPLGTTKSEDNTLVLSVCGSTMEIKKGSVAWYGFQNSPKLPPFFFFFGLCRSTPVRWRLFSLGCPAPSDRKWPAWARAWRNAGTSAASRASRAHKTLPVTLGRGRDDRRTRQHGGWGGHRSDVKDTTHNKPAAIKDGELYLAVRGHECYRSFAESLCSESET